MSTAMRIRYSRASAFAALLILPALAHALVAVTDRAALAANDRLEWNATGKVVDPLNVNPGDFLSNSFSVVSEDGLGISVSIPAVSSPISPPLVFQTNPAPSAIPTNFAAGDYILFAGAQPRVFPAPGNPGPLTISFASPVRGAGTQIAVDDTTGGYTISLSVYNTLSDLIGTYTINATSSVVLDNSAVFLGAKSDTAEIARLVYSSSVSDRAIGINQLSLLNDLPEPGGLFACGLAVLAGRRLVARVKAG